MKNETSCPDLIAIDDWQDFLCYWRSTTPRPKLEKLQSRWIWQADCWNVFKYSTQLEQYLSQEGLRFHTIEVGA